MMAVPKTAAIKFSSKNPKPLRGAPQDYVFRGNLLRIGILMQTAFVRSELALILSS